MVGSAQYRDDEIGWILAAVVARKKQEFIKRNFEDKFGRPLNHNQIRYIKNKYGKDPRFNSPLINIRPSRTAASPSSGTPDSNDQEEIVPIQAICPSEDGFRARISDSLHNSQPKRKRSFEDGDENQESPNHRRTKSQCSVTNSDSMMGDFQGGVTAAEMPQWVTFGTPLTASLSPPSATPEASCGDLSSMYGTRQQQLMQGTGSYNWPSSNDLWRFGEPSGLIYSSRHHPPTALQDVSPFLIEVNKCFEQTPAVYPFQSPPRTHQSCSQAPPPYSVGVQQYSSFTPSLKHAVFSPSVAVESRHRLSSANYSSPNQDLSIQQILTGLHPFSPPMKHDPIQTTLIEPFMERQIPSLDRVLDSPPAEYTISPRDTATATMLPPGPHDLFVAGSISGHRPWQCEDVQAIDFTRKGQQREGQISEEQALFPNEQRLGSPAPIHESQGALINPASDLHILAQAGHDIPREVPVDAAQFTAAVYAQTLSPSVAAEFLFPKKAMTTQTQQCREIEHHQICIDPELLLAFPLADRD